MARSNVLAFFQPDTSSVSGSTAIRWSPSGANRSTDCSPDTATPIGTPPSGASHTRAESIRK
jgi:hypothetical protein